MKYIVYVMSFIVHYIALSVSTATFCNCGYVGITILVARGNVWINV